MAGLKFLFESKSKERKISIINKIIYASDKKEKKNMDVKQKNNNKHGNKY